MSSRRQRALASAVGALLVAVICAALASDVHGTRHTVLLLISIVWLVIGTAGVVNTLRSAPAESPPVDAAATDVVGDNEPQ